MHGFGEQLVPSPRYSVEQFAAVAVQHPPVAVQHAPV
jgi:hypothetical protein